MNRFMRVALIVFAVIYLVCPDLLPGPVDDIIIMIVSMLFTSELEESEAGKAESDSVRQ